MHYGSPILSLQVRYLSENLPKVSGHYRQYSHFRETLGGDFSDIDCEVDVEVEVASLYAVFQRPVTQAKQTIDVRECASANDPERTSSHRDGVVSIRR